MFIHDKEDDRSHTASLQEDQLGPHPRLDHVMLLRTCIERRLSHPDFHPCDN